TWSDPFGTFPWWRVVVALLVAGLGFEFVMVRRRTVRARWKGAERLFLGRVEPLELELRADAGRMLTVRTLPVLPEGIDETDRSERDAAAGVSEERDAHDT